DIIALVRRLEHIHFWERQLDRKTHLAAQRKAQAEARERLVWKYGRSPAGTWKDPSGKLHLEPIEFEIIKASGARVLSGETVYGIAETAGYDHRTLRDILKDPYNIKLGIFSEIESYRIGEVL